MSAPVVLYKRWRLRGEASVEEVAALVADAVAPHYRALHPDVVLGLESWDDRTVTTIQRWPDRATLDAATTGPGFEAWWQAYAPTLARWDALVDFVEEWESASLL